MCGSGGVGGFKVLSKMSGVLFIKIVIAFFGRGRLFVVLTAFSRSR